MASASKSKTLYAPASTKYGYTFKCSFSESSPSVANNTSVITASGSLGATLIGWDSGASSTLKLYWHDNRTNKDTLIASTSFKTCGMGFGTRSVSGSITVTHKDDGSLSGYVKLVYDDVGSYLAYRPEAATIQTDNTALTTIARASSISSITGGTQLGQSVTVNISRKSSDFTHKVEYSFAGSSYTTVSSSAGTSLSFTPPVSLATQIPNSTSGTLTVRVTTYNGSTQVGSSVTSTKALSVPSNVVPTISGFTATRVDNGVPSSWGIYVQGFSKCTLAMSGVSGVYGSTIKTYSISGPGINVSSSSGTTSVLSGTGTQTYTAKVTDSRGRTATKTVQITVQAYSVPSISVSAQRCDSSGTINASSGTYISVTVDFAYTSLSGKNSITSKNVTCNGKSNTTFADNVTFILAANVSIGTTYTLTASVTDALGRVASTSALIRSALRIMNVKKNKKGVAFGKFAEKDEAVEMGWDLYLKSGNICLDYDVISTF